MSWLPSCSGGRRPCDLTGIAVALSTVCDYTAVLFEVLSLELPLAPRPSPQPCYGTRLASGSLSFVFPRVLEYEKQIFPKATQALNACEGNMRTPTRLQTPVDFNTAVFPSGFWYDAPTSHPWLQDNYTDSNSHSYSCSRERAVDPASPSAEEGIDHAVCLL